MLDSNKIPNAFSVRLYHESKSTDFLKPLKNCGCMSTDECMFALSYLKWQKVFALVSLNLRIISINKLKNKCEYLVFDFCMKLHKLMGFITTEESVRNFSINHVQAAS